ncbi:MAG: ABC transporter permease subunit [Oscillospiraceae bacterium]|nr:ABC transporter permease subunit [Oscillospiraceae bacterium]
MTDSTTGRSGKTEIIKRAAVGLFWLAVWQLAAVLVGEPLFLPSPVSVARTFVSLLGQAAFYAAVGNSFCRITAGFLLAALAGLLLAAAAARFDAVKTLLSPLMGAVKATPVASFIILALIIATSARLSTLIAFLMALPVVYGNTLAGIEAIPPTMFYPADVFGMTRGTRLRYIYFPEVFPYFRAACSTALGLSWKAGVAAEVIGIAAGTVGEKLYEAKIYLNIPELFSYTLTIVLLSLLLEKLLSAALRALFNAVLGYTRENSPLQ